VLLMPIDLLRHDVRDLVGDRIDLENDRAVVKLAKKYEVSPQAMLIRLSNEFKLQL
jgi:hypothetical protein